MSLRDFLDEYIETSIIESYDQDVAVSILLSENFSFFDEESGEVVTLLEARRIYRQLPGGRKMLLRKTGPVSQKRRLAAKKAARKGRAARMRAARNPMSKRKRARTMMDRKRLFGGSRRAKGPGKVTRRPRPAIRRPRPSYRGTHGSRRHGPPRVHRYGR